MTKKLFSVAMLVGASVLAACGGGPGDPQGQTSGAAVIAPVATGDAQASVAFSLADGVTPPPGYTGDKSISIRGTRADLASRVASARTEIEALSDIPGERLIAVTVEADSIATTFVLSLEGAEKLKAVIDELALSSTPGIGSPGGVRPADVCNWACTCYMGFTADCNSSLCFSQLWDCSSVSAVGSWL